MQSLEIRISISIKIEANLDDLNHSLFTSVREYWESIPLYSLSLFLLNDSVINS